MKVIDLLLDSLNATIPHVWRDVQHGKITDFVIDGHQYRAMVEDDFLPECNNCPLLRGKRIGHFSFGLQTSGSQYYQGSANVHGMNTTKIFGIIKNMIKARYEQDYDVIYFAAKDPARESLYGKIAMRIAIEAGGDYETFRTPSALVFVVARFDLRPALSWLESNFNFN